MNKLRLVIGGGYMIRADFEILVLFDEDPALNELMSRKNITAMTEEDYPVIEKYTRDVLVQIGLVNYTSYAILIGDKRLGLRSSKRVRFNIADISHLSERDFNNMFRELKPRRYYTIRLLDHGQDLQENSDN